jgi:hypothetical protein
MNTDLRFSSLRLSSFPTRGFAAVFAIATGLAGVSCSNSPQTTGSVRTGNPTSSASVAANVDESTDGGSSSVLPACAWPASLGDGGLVPGERSSWTVGRTFLECTYPAYSDGCLGDSLTACPGDDADPVTSASSADASEGSCVDQCATDEYALMVLLPPFVAPDAGASDTPSPNACRVAAVTPGGRTYYCCACE